MTFCERKEKNSVNIFLNGDLSLLLFKPQMNKTIFENFLLLKMHPFFVLGTPTGPKQ